MRTPAASLSGRLRAWWDGEPMPAQSGAIRAARPAKDAAARDDGTADPPDARLDAMQMIFGEGFTGPGGAAAAVRLVEGLGLNASSNVLEIGAGLGGTTRAIAGHSGAYVTGLEFDPDMARQACIQARRHQLAKKASVEALDPRTLSLRESRYRAVVVRHVLHRIAARRAFLLALAKSLQTGGRMVIYDVFLAPGSDPRAYTDWFGGLPAEVFAPDVDELAAEVKSIGLEISAVQDLTERYCADLLEAWRGVPRTLAASRPPEVVAARIVAEAETWSRRLRLLEAGALGIHALVGART